MKRSSKLWTMFFMVCLVITSVFCFPNLAYAKKAVTVQQVKKLAQKQVKGATILKVKQEREDGVLVYDVKMRKGKKDYELIFRKSDGKLTEYEWEIQSWYWKKGKGAVMSVNKCKKLAKKQVSNGKVTSVVRKRSHGVDLYKVKVQKGSKKYEMKFHARTGKLMEYQWDLVTKNNSVTNEDVIGEERAKEIALAKTGGGTVVKVKFDMDDGVPVYEVEVIYGNYEYEVEIHAQTGKVLKVDKEWHKEAGQTDIDHKISLKEAKNIATADAGYSAGEVTFTKAKLDKDDGISVYDIEFYTDEYEYEYEIDAVTGAVRSKDVEKRKTSAGNVPTNVIGEQRAKELALTQAGGGKVIKVEFDMDDGVPVYEVEVIFGESEYEVKIHAQTGKILEVDMESIYD